MSADTTYYFRVLPTKSGADQPPSAVVSATTRANAGDGDYDADNDGLIEITTLAQLNVVRYDLDGDGVPSTGNETAYNSAFSNAEDNMGCNEGVATIQSGTGNLACSGYELAADLDFDTNNDGTINSSDTYWNSGQGWLPIGATAGGTSASAFTSTFDGGTSTISNLHVNRSGATTVAHGGLFAELSSAARVKNLRLEGVSVTVTTHVTAATPADLFVGGIAGKSAGAITGSYVLGAVKAVQSENTANNNEKHAYAGGLVGLEHRRHHQQLLPRRRYGGAAQHDCPADGRRGRHRGLPGHGRLGDGVVLHRQVIKAETHSASGGDVNVGGLLGRQQAGSVSASYSHAHPDAKAPTTAAGVTLDTGGLVGHIESAGSITASFSTGAPTQSGGNNPAVRQAGLVGNYVAGTITNSYWDTETSGRTIGTAGSGTPTGVTGTTTAQLQAPTGYTGIYANWNLDLDGDSTNDDPWDFGTASQYPVIDYGLAAANQRAAVTLAATPATICESPKGTTPCGNATPPISTTLTAAISPAQQVDVVVAITPSTSDFTLVAPTSITIAAGAATGTGSVTLAAVNNKKCGTADCTGTNASDNSLTVAGTTAQNWANIAGASLTITDDDILPTPVMTLTTQTNFTSMKVDWTAVPTATGYMLEYRGTHPPPIGSWISAMGLTGASRTYTFSNLNSRYEYEFRLAATRTGYDDSAWATSVTSPGKDYDADDDGLIEVTTLAQLNAIRYDLNGNGEVDDPTDGAATSTYNAAFPTPKTGMGCNEDEMLPADRVCDGYELSNSLNFDTNGDGSITAADYVDLNGNNSKDAGEDSIIWNNGLGWDPIGGTTGGSYVGSSTATPTPSATCSSTRRAARATTPASSPTSATQRSRTWASRTWTSRSRPPARSTCTLAGWRAGFARAAWLSAAATVSAAPTPRARFPSWPPRPPPTSTCLLAGWQARWRAAW